MARIFTELYSEIVSRIRESAVFGTECDQVRDGTLVDYATQDGTKRIYSTGDYPRLEVIPVSLDVDGGTSNARCYLQSYKVTVATGALDFAGRFFPIQKELLAVAEELAAWRKQYANGDTVLGANHTQVTYGKFAPEKGRDAEDGWAFQFSLTFRILITHKVQNTITE